MHRVGLDSQVSLLPPHHQPPLALRVAALHTVSILKPFSGLPLARAPLLTQEGSSVTISVTLDGPRAAQPSQGLVLC